jgi:inositol 1,4,5-triphosphate receptor type 1
MLYYIIYIKRKNLNDCNALEKYVKNCIDKKDTKFFPFKRALQIEEAE